MSHGAVGAIVAGVFVLLAGKATLAAEVVDPGNSGRQYAWGPNIGWINAEPLGDGGLGLQITNSRVTGWLWSSNLGWISLSCLNTSSCATVDDGVRVVGGPELSGWGWSPNIGWISFSCLTTESCGTVVYGITADSAGDLAGYAWSPNAGWISASCIDGGSCSGVRRSVQTAV
jgi:hypothetical protein